ncbi:hypothetical protein BDU57DRAFT_58538 [Ampelomyces quisqualis]|uniref:Extracellular membrane protein CFEM domain-containing protein n=1 Tax=Ampelomyces quisqualis TaxID=50730 RepID=A0A6A5R3U0_AMPQU|nr:hypothetical protein BDU57DRAFT_58538 [Ampelomyces quisqualis]
MHFTTAIMALAATAGLVAAQNKCDAQNIVNACVSGYQSRIDACNANGNDFICLCDVYKDVLVCYDNCPNSSDKPPVQNTVTSYCNAALPLRPAASASAASVASVAATQSKALASATTRPTGTGAGSAVSGGPTPAASSFQGRAGEVVVGERVGVITNTEILNIYSGSVVETCGSGDGCWLEEVLRTIFSICSWASCSVAVAEAIREDALLRCLENT